MKTPAPWMLDRVEQALLSAKHVVIDLETEGLDWRHHKTCGYVLNFGPSPDDGTYLPVRHKGNEGRGNLDPKKVARCVDFAMSMNSSVRMIGHNLHFDLKFMHAEGINISALAEPYEDTQINAFLIDENQRSFSLDACCRTAGVIEKKGDDLYKHLAASFGGDPARSQMGNFHRLAADDALGIDYALGDGVSTWQLWAAQQKPLDDDDLRNIWMIERRCIRVLARMSLRGLRIDEERLHQIRKLVKRRTDAARKLLPKDFNPRAPTQMKTLMEKNGVTDWPITAKGAPSFLKDWLKKSEIGRAVVSVRELDMLENSFIAPMVDRHLWKGRVHTTYNQTRGEEFGTVTGRLSSTDPNLQQIHKRDFVLGSLFRSIAIPDEGKIMAAADYEQIEPRLLAHYADVQMLIDGYLADPPIDAHSIVAMSAFGYDPKDKSEANKAKRQYGKTLNQALLTGAGEAKAALMLGLPHADAQRIVQAYFRSMPELKPAQRKVTSVFTVNRYITSLLGRRARLDDPRLAYRGMNRLLQCGNADILKKSMADIDEFFLREGDEVNLLNNIHDDLMFQFSEDHRKTYERALEVMCDYGPDGQSVYIVVPLAVDAKEGKNWAEASYGVNTVKIAFKEMGAVYK